MLSFSISAEQIDLEINQVLIKFFEENDALRYKRELDFLASNVLTSENIHRAEGDYYCLWGEALKYFYFKALYLFELDKTPNGGLTSMLIDLTEMRGERYHDWEIFTISDLQQMIVFIENLRGSYNGIYPEYIKRSLEALTISINHNKSRHAKLSQEKASSPIKIKRSVR